MRCASLAVTLAIATIAGRADAQLFPRAPPRISLGVAAAAAKAAPAKRAEPSATAPTSATRVVVDPAGAAFWRKVRAVTGASPSGVADDDLAKLEALADPASAKEEARLHKIRAAQMQKLAELATAAGEGAKLDRALRLVEKERLRHALALLTLPRRAP